MKWVDRQPDFDAMIAALRGAGTLAVDTEADSLHSYFDKTCLIQISAAGEDYVIDPLAKIDLAALGEILADPSIPKILHGADYDIRIMQRDFGFLVTSLTDTMICAQLLGYEGIGLAALLQRHFGIELDKTHQRADWGMRPLPPDMLRYAALDTHYLVDLAAKVREELVAAGRWSWAEEEFRRLEAIRYESSEYDEEAYRKLKGSNKLEPRSLAALSMIFRWRDDTARKLDRPPFKVMSNEAMVEIATRLPKDRAELAQIRGVSSYQISRYERELMGAVQKAQAMDPSQLPSRTPAKAWIRDRDLERRIEKLKKTRDAIAAELKIEASVIAPRHVLTAVATMRPTTVEELEAIPAMRVWQRGVVGPAFVAAMAD